MSNIKKNLGLQTTYQVLNTIIPLITAPYLARTLGNSKLGVFSYTTSVVLYFAMFAMLGTVNYGTRSIAEVKDSKTELSKTFYSIYAMQFFTTLISLVVYLIYLGTFNIEYKVVSTIQMITLLSCFFDISWFYFGIENFKVTVIRSIVVRILTVISIFLFVKSPQDLDKYTFIMLGGTFISQIILWVNLKKYITKVKITRYDILKHIRPNINLFIPLMAMSVYHLMDKTMLGLMSTEDQSGYYYNSDKIINIPLGILNGVGTVMLPRMSSLFKENKIEEANNLFLGSIEGILVATIGMSFGIAAVAENFIPVFYGPGYEECIILTYLFAPILVIKSLSVTVRTQYLIPLNKEKEFTKSVIVGAITNVIVNLLLIPKFGARGAVLSTMLAELMACIFQFRSVVGRIKIGKVFKRGFFYVLIGVIMLIIVKLASSFTKSNFMGLILGIPIGAIIYLVLSIIFWKITGNKLFGFLLTNIKRKKINN